MPRKHPFPRQLSQRFEIELRGHQYYVVDTKTDATVGGPFRKREKAQQKADEMERRTG